MCPALPWLNSTATWRFTAGLLTCLLLVGCSATPRGETSSRAATAAANAVSIHAIGLVGTPYRYGGNTPASGFDCSGLIGYVFREAAGIVLPRTTRDLGEMSLPAIKPEALRPGDLVLFGRRGRADHAGIFVGEGRFVHAPSSGGTVRIDALDSVYWKGRLIGGRRPIR